MFFPYYSTFRKYYFHNSVQDNQTSLVFGKKAKLHLLILDKH